MLGLRESSDVKFLCLYLGSALACILFCTPGAGFAKHDSVDSLVSLSHIRHRVLTDSVAGLMGKTVTVRGTATVGTGLLHERYLQVFIQNDSAGLSLFKNTINQPISPGDSVIATGEVKKYFGLIEVEIAEYEVHTGNTEVPKPIELSMAVLTPEVYEGMLIAGAGIVKDKGNRYNGKYLIVTPKEALKQSIMVYVSNFHSRYQDFDFERLSVGDEINVEGVLSTYNSGEAPFDSYQVLLRTAADLKYKGIPKYYLQITWAIISAISVLILGWVVMLKRQVRKQTSIIKSSLEEKEILLQEIHHRVKNNLSIISGLIELQLDRTSDQEARRVLKDSQVRIHSMAMVHEKLYMTTSLSSIEMDIYIKELVESIHQTFMDKHKNIEVNFNLEPLRLGVGQVIPCGLLINELVVNAFKHAFNRTGSGRLVISFKQKDAMAQLTVADNGPGLPDDFSPDQSSSLGMMLIHTFTAQLSAEMQIDSHNGASFSFRFHPEGE